MIIEGLEKCIANATNIVDLATGEKTIRVSVDIQYNHDDEVVNVQLRLSSIDGVYTFNGTGLLDLLVNVCAFGRKELETLKAVSDRATKLQKLLDV